jgi:hypothetical protein
VDLENLIWALILLSPLLGRLFGKKKRSAKKQAPGRTKPLPAPVETVPEPQPAQRRAESPFEEALRQIQEALAESREEPAPTREPAVQHKPPKVESRHSAVERPPAERPRAPLMRPESERPVVKRKTAPTYDDTFETLDSEFTSSRPRSEAATLLTPKPELSRDPDKGIEVAIAVPDRIDTPSFVVHFGKGGTSFKEAFVYGQIFGPPRSRNPWRTPD